MFTENLEKSTEKDIINQNRILELTTKNKELDACNAKLLAKMETILNENLKMFEDIGKLNSSNLLMSGDINNKDITITNLQNSVKHLTDSKKELSNELELTKARLLHSEQSCNEYKLAQLQSESDINKLKILLANERCQALDSGRLNIHETLDEYFRHGSRVPDHVMDNFKSEPEAKVSIINAQVSKLPSKANDLKQITSHRINTKNKADEIKSRCAKMAMDLLDEQHELGKITREDIITAQPKITNMLYFQRHNGKPPTLFRA